MGIGDTYTEHAFVISILEPVLCSLIKPILSNGPCEGRNKEGIFCVTEVLLTPVLLSPKLLSDPAWVITCSKRVMSLIMEYESH